MTDNQYNHDPVNKGMTQEQFLALCRQKLNQKEDDPTVWGWPDTLKSTVTFIILSSILTIVWWLS